MYRMNYLPLENSLLRHHVRSYVGLQTAAKEMVRHGDDIVIRVMINHRSIHIVFETASVNDFRLASHGGKSGC